MAAEPSSPVTAPSSINEVLRSELAAMARMLQVSSCLIEGGDLSLLLQEILNAAIEITRADLGNIQVLEEDALRIVAQRGFDAPFLEFFKAVHAGQTSCGTAMQVRQRIVVEDVGVSTMFAETAAREVMLDAKALAVQSTPLLSRSGQLIGVLSTHYRHAPHRPSERELNMLDILARQAADLIERKQSEEATSKLAAILDLSQAAILGIDLNGVITIWNKAAEELFGYTAQEAIGQRLSILMPPDRIDEEARELDRVICGERIEQYERVRCRKDGRLLDVHLTISPIRGSKGEVVGAVKILRDTSEQKRTQENLRTLNSELEKLVMEQSAELLSTVEQNKMLHEQLLQAQKMESIGTLAGGIAHDFNNILAVIDGHAFILREYEALDKQIGESLSIINEAVRHGSDLVRQLMGIVRKSSTTVEAVNANVMIENLVAFIRRTFPVSIELETSLKSDLPPIRVQKNQIDQALLNLCVNARDAMPDGGKLIFRTGIVQGEAIRSQGAVREARYVFIEVRDNGTGMDEGIQKRIFEPFYTTKEMGRGTGLGLSAVYEIVKNHNGFIDVESQPNSGTSFRLYFPVALEPSDKETANSF